MTDDSENESEPHSNGSDSSELELCRFDSSESELCGLRSSYESGSSESNSHESKKPLSSPGVELDYSQYLYRLFGKETADYYLLPDRDALYVSPYWYNRLVQDMGDQVSAVSLWDAMRKRNSLHGVEEEESDVASKMIQLCVDWEGQRQRGPLRRLAGVRQMFQLALDRQAFSTQLLQSKPSSLPYEPI